VGDQAREVLAAAGLEMDQERVEEVPVEDRDQGRDRGVWVGEDLEKEQGLAEEVQEGEGLGMDQERDERALVEGGQQFTEQACLTLNMV
jgi:hypothetical protein